MNKYVKGRKPTIYPTGFSIIHYLLTDGALVYVSRRDGGLD